MKLEFRQNDIFNIDLNKINQSINSSESLKANEFIYEERSLEAIRLTEEEFNTQLPKIKEQLGKFYDDFKKNLEEKIEIEFNKNVKEKLLKKQKKDPNNTLPPEKVLVDLKAALQMTKKEEFIKSFIAEITSPGENDKQFKCVLAEFNPVKMVNLNKRGAIVAGSVLAITGLITLGVSTAFAAGAVILGAIFTSIGVKPSESINEKQWKKTNKENIKLDGKKMFKLKRKDVPINGDVIYDHKIVYYLKPKIKIKKGKKENIEE